MNKDEWRAAVASLTEAERALYDDQQTYADSMSPDGTRL